MSTAQVQEQDDLLDSLARGVGKLHQSSVTINEESQLHTRLLNNMDADIDGTITGLKQETKYAEKVRKESGVCNYYIAIFILVALMIFLIVIGTS
mmetsp:Transcript_12829/g.15328  ORF Transcript_12829/g.15328 Transcript_12829/m.15328 type:complete len:95 (+) Transcript_12829:98-382(+)